MPATVDVTGLRQALSEAVDGEVRFGAGDRHLYATDSSNYRQVPLGVVLPRTTDALEAAVAVCRDFDAPVTHRGGGTSLAGQTTNEAVIIDSSKYLRSVVDIDPRNRRARVQPGCVLDDLRDAAEAHQLTFGPDPATHNRNTLGGMIGNNACGVHSVMAGRTSDNVEALEILLYDGTRMTVGSTPEAELDRRIAAGGRIGELYGQLRDLRDRYADLIRAHYPPIPRRVSGYALDELLPENGFNVARSLVGSEGTLVTVVRADVKLVASPPSRTLLVLGYPSVFEAGDHVAEIREAGPIGLEGIDDHLVGNMERKGLHTASIGLLPEGGGWLLVEFGGDSDEEAREQAEALMRELEKAPVRPSMQLYTDSGDADRVWTVRESGLGATAFVPGRPAAWPGWEDAAVAPDQLGGYLRQFRGLLDRHGLEASLYGHFGDGCVHCRITFDLRSTDGVRTFRRFVEDAADLVVAHGGSLSGEHGDGQARAELLERMYGPDLVRAFGEFKAIWDPDGRMNPGKVVDPRPLDADLRLGAGYRPHEPDTHFSYPNDGGSFARAALRCVGVGLCRRDDGKGTMCPSYMVTHEEKHSTRGRARLLFEMLQPGAQLDGWRSEAVADALDLCLSCKGCKVDCPVSVDMATYKAEFAARHWRGRRRPASHYALGLIYWWSRLAARLPGITNLALSAPAVGRLVKRAAGIAPQRPAPLYARQTFVDWFRRRDRGARPDRAKVLLFPDTFTNHFHPGIGKAAVDVLERAGYRVQLPDRILCCGRPLYDFGMLGLARRQLRQAVDALGDDVSAGTEIVGLEPSCTAAFRDELIEMLPNDDGAQRLSRSVRTLAEFLVGHDVDLPPLRRKAVVHGHCHHKAVMGLTAEQQVLDAMGIDATFLDAGCCGLAGSFGFEAGERYEVSVDAGERKLLPAVRGAEDTTLVITDGFSCRTQIDHLQDRRRALHLAEVIALAHAHGPDGPPTNRSPEDWAENHRPARLTARDAAAGGALAAVTALAIYRRRQR